MQNSRILFIALFFCFATIKAQVHLEAGFSMISDADYNIIARGSGLGTSPIFSPALPVSLNLLLEKRKPIISPYIAAVLVHRKVNYSVLNNRGTVWSDFNYQTVEIPAGIRLRKKISENSWLRLNIGAGLNYMISSDLTIVTDENSTFNIIKKDLPGWFTQGGIGFECRISPKNIVSASINYQRQSASFYEFVYTYDWSGAKFATSSTAMMHYFSLNLSYSFTLEKKRVKVQKKD